MDFVGSGTQGECSTHTVPLDSYRKRQGMKAGGVGQGQQSKNGRFAEEMVYVWIMAVTTCTRIFSSWYLV